MARANRKGRTKSVGKFVQLREDMQRSPAWKSLSPNARCVWIEITRRYKGPDYPNEMPLSCREASNLCNISKDSAARAFEQLIDRGFIRLVSDIGFNMKAGRRTRRWSLTHIMSGNNPATNEWKNWAQ